MVQKNLSLQKAAELRMEPISLNKDNNFSTWEALKNDYLNEEKKLESKFERTIVKEEEA